MITFEQFEAQWLEDIQAGNPTTTQLGNRFAQKILHDALEIDEVTAQIMYCDGAGDGGIDAAVFVKADPDEGIDGSTWIIVQSKYGTALSGPNTITLEAQKLFQTLEGRRTSLSSISAELVGRLRHFLANKGHSDKLEYVVATSRKLTDDEQEYLSNVRTLGRDKFGECFQTNAISIETVYNKILEDVEEQNKITVNLDSTVAASTNDLHIGATSLRSVFNFMNDYERKSGDMDMIYQKNVRKFLGSKRKVNKAMEETLESTPERFGLYNNGITIVAEKLTKHDNGLISLVNPYIVNGCQTTRSIWSVLQRKLNSGGSAPSEKQKDWENRLDEGVVVTKIVLVGAGGEDLLTETTRFTNSQNAVGEKDFIALEADFRTWAPSFSRQFGVFLEIQRGAWEAQRARQKQNPSETPQYTKTANAFDLLKAYAAGWLNEPGIAFGKNPPFAPGGTLFKKIVNDPDFGTESLFAAYRLQQLTESYGFGRAAKRPSRGQTRYLFMMVVLNVVKDSLIQKNQSCDVATLVKAVLALSEANLMQHFGDVAVSAIDDYMTAAGSDTIYLEPEYSKNNDLNAFLKSEKLGKNDDFSPNLRMQITLAKRDFRRGSYLENVNRVLSSIAKPVTVV
jgi:hypothetical protein